MNNHRYELNFFRFALVRYGLVRLGLVWVELLYNHCLLSLLESCAWTANVSGVS